MKTQVDIKYLAELARTGDDDHRMLVTVVSALRNELRHQQNRADDLSYELQRCLAENRFLVQQLQEES